MTDQKQKAGALKVGAAQVDITPKMGTQIGGDIGRRRPAELVVDPIYAKALVLESGGRKACLLSLDLTLVTAEWTAEIRRLAAERFALAPEAVMVHPVQNHAAPYLGHAFVRDACKLIPPEFRWLRGGDDDYHLFAVERIIEAIRLANERLEPVQFGAASGMESRVAFNRRFIMRNGTAATHPAVGDPNILHTEGPIDPELGVVCFTREDLKIPAVLLHHTCHPVHGYPHRYITAGWPGAWSQGVKGLCGEDCVPLVINGFCGNVHHVNHLDPNYVDDYRRMGRLLTETTEKVLKTVTYQNEGVLDWKAKRLKIRLREFDPKELEAARKLVAENPEPMWSNKEKTAVSWEWVYAVANLDLYEEQQETPEFEYEIQVFRLGDVALVAVPGEPFVEGQLRIKLESPVRYTYLAHMSNMYAGYVPTKEAVNRGGTFETRISRWSKLVPEALDMIVEEAVGMLKEVFGQ